MPTTPKQDPIHGWTVDLTIKNGTIPELTAFDPGGGPRDYILMTGESGIDIAVMRDVMTRYVLQEQARKKVKGADKLLARHLIVEKHNAAQRAALAVLDQEEGS